MYCIKVLASTVGAAAALLALFIVSGVYNVSASVPHWAVTALLLEGAREQSVWFHASKSALPDLSNPKLAEVGVRHFQPMCRLCHGAPGQERREFAKGLNPGPPDLASGEVQENSDAELFWIVTNGIKMTGMPAFGATHGREEIAGIVALVRRLPKMSPEEYGALAASVGQEGEGGMHRGQAAP